MRHSTVFRAILLGLFTTAIALPAKQMTRDAEEYAPEPILEGATIGSVDFKSALPRANVPRGDSGSITYVKPLSEVKPIERR
ncbi:MAG: hypothetical protein MMC33_000508 [Icmadophila ericetorum]|nr:hypothetical protein [Icmadophila ericetorum]